MKLGNMTRCAIPENRIRRPAARFAGHEQQHRHRSTLKQLTRNTLLAIRYPVSPNVVRVIYSVCGNRRTTKAGDAVDARVSSAMQALTGKTGRITAFPGEFSLELFEEDCVQHRCIGQMFD